MAEKTKPEAQSVRETLAAELGAEGRHPAASEERWAEEVLAPTLEKAPVER